MVGRSYQKIFLHLTDLRIGHSLIKVSTQISPNEQALNLSRARAHIYDFVFLFDENYRTLSTGQHGTHTMELRHDLNTTKSNSFGQIQPFLSDDAVIYGSQPVPVGTDITLTLTSTDIKENACTGDAFDRDWVSTLSREHEAALQSLATKTLSRFKAGSVRLLGKLVQPHPDLAGYIDIYRTLVFIDDGCIFDYSYQMQIFEEDYGRTPRFVVSVKKNTAKAVQTITRDATAAFIRSDPRSENDAVCFEGFCWMSVHQARYLPGIFVPYEPGRFSEMDTCDWMIKVLRQGFPDIAFVDHLNGVEWP